ncbi:MAG TPA: sensor histidine kinase [Jatrophihabitans sp.]|nr:sensor histidine kinase [Jatrophihabitans sp.]
MSSQRGNKPVATVPVSRARTASAPTRKNSDQSWPGSRAGLRGDTVLALGATVATVAAKLQQADPVDPVGWALLGAATLCLAWRRRSPLTVLLISCGCSCVYVALGYPHPPLPFAMLVAVYTVATRTAALTAAAASGAAMLAASSSKLVREGWSPEILDDTLVAYLLSIGAACALGYGVQLTRARNELLQQQAVRLAEEHAAHEQQSLQGQRIRIARDMHDVVSHQLALITALAAGAGQLFESRPHQARSAITSIETAGREALAEMRRLLRVLRPDGDERVGEDQPSLIQVADLITQTTRAGLPVALQIHGAQRELPTGVELCAFRIVQESLTNALKHAGPAQATVELRYEPGVLDIRVADTGRGMSRHPGAGHGFVGMRERTTLVGGQLEIGESPEHGVQIHARLPLETPGR